MLSKDWLIWVYIREVRFRCRKVCEALKKKLEPMKWKINIRS